MCPSAPNACLPHLECHLFPWLALILPLRPESRNTSGQKKKKTLGFLKNKIPKYNMVHSCLTIWSIYSPVCLFLANVQSIFLSIFTTRHLLVFTLCPALLKAFCTYYFFLLQELSDGSSVIVPVLYRTQGFSASSTIRGIENTFFNPGFHLRQFTSLYCYSPLFLKQGLFRFSCRKSLGYVRFGTWNTLYFPKLLHYPPYSITLSVGFGTSPFNETCDT